MDWERFHYLCRRYQALNLQGQGFPKAISILEQQPTTDLYGKGTSTNDKSLAATLLHTLKTSTNTDQVNQATAIYAALDIHSLLSKTSGAKRFLLYIGLLLAYFILTYSIMYIYVIPNFIEFWQNYSDEVSQPLEQVRAYYPLMALVLLVLFLVAGLFNWVLYKINNLSVTHKDKCLLKLLPNHIKKHYHNLITLLEAPLYLSSTSNSQTNSIVLHLRQLIDANSDVVSELSVLIRRESASLAQSQEHFRLVAYSILFGSVLLVIAFFVIFSYRIFYSIAGLV